MLSFPVPAATREKLIAHLRAMGSEKSGNYGHRGRPGQVGGSGSGRDAQYTRDFDIKTLNPNGQRFMIKPGSTKMLIGDRSVGLDSRRREDGYVPGSHAEEFAQAKKDFQLPGQYDDYVKGWVFGPDDEGPDGSIQIYEKYFYDDFNGAKAFDAYYDVAEAFVNAGKATERTLIIDANTLMPRGKVVSPWKPKQTMGDVFPSLFTEQAKRMRAAGFYSPDLIKYLETYGQSFTPAPVRCTSSKARTASVTATRHSS